MEEKCDFQRSMANNEAKLKQNEDDLRRAQREFVENLEKANLAYSRNRWVLAPLIFKYVVRLRLHQATQLFNL